MHTRPDRIGRLKSSLLRPVQIIAEFQDIRSDINMWLDYLLLVVLTAMGFLQLTAFQSKIQHLQLSGNRRLNCTTFLFLLILPSTWFFATDNRNLPDTNGGLDGGDQTLLFVGGCIVALIATLAISHVRRFGPSPTRHYVKGLDALRNESYVAAVLQNLKILRRKWKP